MRIALLSGADKNAGDFLITKRSVDLIRHFHPEASIFQYKRNEGLSSRVEEINESDYLVFAGGPGYLPRAYPEKFPLVKDLKDLSPRFFALGMGSYTKGPSVAGYDFSAQTRKLLDRFTEDGMRLGCRDLVSKRVLESNGYADTVFTGCPAWYDIKIVKDELQNDVRYRIPSDIKRIAISDPAATSNVSVAKQLVVSLRKLFPNAELLFVFHRGWVGDRYTDMLSAQRKGELHKWLSDRGIRSVDISYSCDGFEVYNTVDVHVGFRVHAHIFCLSQRMPSFLIEEDGRGYGANEALGLSHVGPLMMTSFRLMLEKVARRFGAGVSYPVRSGMQMVADMEKIILDEMDGGFALTEKAFDRMRLAFFEMGKHVSSLS